MRVEGWERLLAEHIEAAGGRTFQWGEHDCALWASAWVAKCTGRDFGETWRGRYDDEAGAKALMRRRRLKSVEAIADRHLLSKPILLARRGDLVLHPDGPLGISDGRTAYFITPTGVTALPTLSCPKAWGVD